MNKIKKIIVLVLVMFMCFCFTACSYESSINGIDDPEDPTDPGTVIDNPAQPDTPDTPDEPDEPENQDDNNGTKKLSTVNYDLTDRKFITAEKQDIDSINAFAINTFKELLANDTKNKDIFYSPASFYMALSMLTEGADGNTYAQLMNMLFNSSSISSSSEVPTLNDLRTNNSILYKNNNFINDSGKAKIANSIWIKTDKEVKQEYIEELVRDYYAETYSTPMDEETLELIAKWINENTFDVLNVKKDDLKQLLDNALVLVNTIYFKNKWANQFSEELNVKMTFNNSSASKVEFMHHTVASFYYDRDKYTCASDSFENGYKIYYCLPKDNYTVTDCLDDLQNVVNGNIRYRTEAVHIYVPKFKFQNELNLVDTCKALGVTDAFSPVDANFSNLTDGVYVDSIKQIAKIDLNEKGVEAAAATIIGMKETAINPDDIIKFVLDKPFLYYIVDGNNTIMFMGICENPTYTSNID